MQRAKQSHEFSKLVLGSLSIPLCIFLLLSMLFWQWQGEIAGKSALLGGLIAWLPALYFSLKMLRFSAKNEQQARQIVRSFYRAEAGKLILAAALCAVVFAQIKPINAAVLFAVFFCTQLSGSFAPFFVKTAKTSAI